MNILYLISVFFYFISCTPTSSKSGKYAKFYIQTQMPDPLGNVGDKPYINRNFFYSYDSLNILEVYSLHSEAGEKNIPETDTIVIIMNQTNEKKQIDGYLVYNYKNKDEPGLFISNLDGDRLIDVDSFFKINTARIKLDEDYIKLNYAFATSIEKDGILLKSYAAITKSESSIDSDSLLLFYSKKAMGINYMLTKSFQVPDKKLFKIVSKVKKGLSEEGSEISDHNQIVFEFSELPLNKKDSAFINMCIKKYHSIKTN